MTSHTGMLVTRPNQYTAHRWTDLDYIEHHKRRITVTETGCWVHNGLQSWSKGMPKGSPGYIQVSIRGKRWFLHRFFHTVFNGPIPARHVVAHRCDNPPCCNPAHLFACTERENIADAAAKKRHYNGKQTHCRHGHEFTPENTYSSPVEGRPGLFRRHCKTCAAISHKSPEYIAWRREYQRMRRALKRAHRSDEDVSK